MYIYLIIMKGKTIFPIISQVIEIINRVQFNYAVTVQWSWNQIDCQCQTRLIKFQSGKLQNKFSLITKNLVANIIKNELQNYQSYVKLFCFNADINFTYY